jgi:DNA-binding CsgD family transcriptional regulator
MNGLWLRCHLAMRDAAQGALTRAVAEMERIDRTKLKPTGIAFVDALLAVLLASSDPDRAEALLARPVLAAADLNVETTRFLVFAQTYHALGQWLIGRGRAARRSRLPNVNDLVPSDAVHVNVIATICSTSRQTTTSRQLDQLTEPLVALGHLGIARFLREVLKPTVVHELTRTELDVLRALRTGGTTAEVAERLGKSSHTVHSHIKSACTKIGCSGRAAAVSYAVAQGWLD